MNWFEKFYHFLLFIGFYLVKLIMANLVLAHDILTPKMRFNPGMIELELKPLSKFGLLMVSNLVSMTPGTLSTDLDLERNILHVHVLYLDRQEKIKQEVYQIMDRVGRFTN
jgi:multicomponent Na+:H+ antiporter subunit E